MRYAETGFNLEVDLTRGNIERVPTDPKLSELHLGGLGTNARLLWDRVPPEVEPFSPDNLLVFGTGLLAGTPAPGCNRTIVSAISPQTRLFAFSMMGGFWGPELKYAGYDKVVIRGKAPDLVYLWIHDDEVEIRDATHYRLASPDGLVVNLPHARPRVAFGDYPLPEAPFRLIWLRRRDEGLHLRVLFQDKLPGYRLKIQAGAVRVMLEADGAE